MKIIRLIFFLTIGCFGGQRLAAQNADELQTTARSFTQQGDYANSVLVLNRAIQLSPGNLEITKDLAMAYYQQGDNAKALETIKPLLDREDADDQCYQIAGNIYKQLDQTKECDKLFRKGIKRFPTSGALYNELGELMAAHQDATAAIKQWEKGIEIDPNFAKNYYNACKYYALTADNIWSILYGEIFVNMAPLGSRAPEIKILLLEDYKYFYTSTNNYTIAPNSKDKNKFAAAFVETMNKQSQLANTGINAEVLTMIRTRFILDWFNTFADRFAFKLFDTQKQLLQEGLFDAYNQWLFGAVQNLSAYQNWTIAHATTNTEFTSFQRGRIFKIPQQQYYRY